MLVKGLGSIEGYEKLRISYCLDNRLIDGGKFVSACLCFTAQKHYISVSGTNFCYLLSKSQGPVRLKGLRIDKNHS
jgi:hypothetical protein